MWLWPLLPWSDGKSRFILFTRTWRRKQGKAISFPTKERTSPLKYIASLVKPPDRGYHAQYVKSQSTRRHAQINVSDAATIVYRGHHLQVSNGHTGLSICQWLPSASTRTRTKEQRNAFLSHACLPRSDILFNACRTIFHSLPHCWRSFRSSFPQTMVRHNSSSLFFIAPYFCKAFNCFLGSGINGKMAKFLSILILKMGT